jgi:hypothetical protein
MYCIYGAQTYLGTSYSRYCSCCKLTNSQIILQYALNPIFENTHYSMIINTTKKVEIKYKIRIVSILVVAFVERDVIIIYPLYLLGY